MQASFATVSPQLATPTTITLGTLLRDFQLGLVLIAGGSRDTAGLPVQWVHSSDLEDPSPFLTPRTVLLTTGSQFGQHFESEDAAAYVRRLVAAGTTALGVSVGLRWDRIPPSLIEACDRLHLPLFRVPYDTPFLAVVRTAARLLEAEAHAQEQRERKRSSASSMLSRREDLQAAERALREAVLQLLLAGQHELAERVADPLLPELPTGQLHALSLRAPLPPKAGIDIAPLIEHQDGAFSAVTGGRLTVILEHRHLAALARALTRHGLAAGVSERGEMSALGEMVTQAERAAELAELNEDAAVLDYRPEMHAGVLQLLQSSPEAARRANGLIAPLVRHDERHGDELLRSMGLWLAHHGQLSPAAAELGVHRHTLRSRVRAAASLLQRDLDSPDARAELWAALRLSGHAPTAG